MSVLEILKKSNFSKNLRFFFTYLAFLARSYEMLDLFQSFYFQDIFKESALWAESFYKSNCPYVCLCVFVFVCVFVRHTLSLRLLVFFPQFPKVQCPNF